MNTMTKKEFREKYENAGHTGLPKCKCCGRIDTDFSMYNEIVED